MGTNVDCYQRAEGRYRLMPGILAALRDAANPFSILTKGTLILRDLDLIGEAADRTEVGLAVSVGCADTGLWRELEPGAPSPPRRRGVCGAYAPAAYQQRVAEQVRALARKYGVGRGAPGGRRGRPRRFAPPAERRPEPQAAAPQQLTLL